jgi:hypothetical protein
MCINILIYKKYAPVQSFTGAFSLEAYCMRDSELILLQREEYAPGPGAETHSGYAQHKYP